MSLGQSSQAISDIAATTPRVAAELLLRASEVYARLGVEQQNRECSSGEHGARRITEVSVELLEAQRAMAPLASLASRAVEAACKSI